MAEYQTHKKFALIGAAGFIAPRHFRAIKETQNQLVAAFDPNDSVGIMDSYFPKADFFTEYERFDRHLDKLKRQNQKVDFLSVCSPNYLHDSHIRFGLRSGMDVICEKPLVLNPWNLDALKTLELETGKRVFTILQLRHHPNIIELKRKVESAPTGKIFDVDLTYITSRGKWYYASWKSDIQKSGGIATNIGIHFFDMLMWVFGKPVSSSVFINTHDRASGYLQLEKARVRWFLSINPDTLPEEVMQKNKSTYRSVQIEGKETEFSDNFDNLHTIAYSEILSGNGYGVDEARDSVQLCHQIRNASCETLNDLSHPFAYLPLSKHPFY
jgi:UDP-N-acetyl-2-amino-2-deoxyglucuronate dehydrogenase